jgi:hypothetical protein
MRTNRQVSLLLLAAFVAGGCMTPAGAPKIGLDRSLYPGLGDLDASEIPAAFETRVELRAPLSGGIVWLDDDRSGFHGAALSEYLRTGILERVAVALRRSPFEEVGSLPTTSSFQRHDDGAPPVDSIRSAAARFQYDVAFILQTGLATESGVNPFSIGYIGLVTAPLFPGNDVSVAAAAELCAVDVRSGVMLGCGIGRAYEEARFLFPWRTAARSNAMHESTVARAAEDAAKDVALQIARRVSR